MLDALSSQQENFRVRDGLVSKVGSGFVPAKIFYNRVGEYYE